MIKIYIYLVAYMDMGKLTKNCDFRKKMLSLKIKYLDFQKSNQNNLTTDSQLRIWAFKNNQKESFDDFHNFEKNQFES